MDIRPEACEIRGPVTLRMGAVFYSFHTQRLPEIELALNVYADFCT